MTIDDFSREALDLLPADDRRAFDPFTIAILLGVISAVVSHFVSRCLDRLDRSALQSPGYLQRYALRRQVKAEFRRQAPGLLSDFAEPVVAAILERAATASPAQIHAVCASVQE